MRQRQYRLLTTLMVSAALGGCSAHTEDRAPASATDDPFAKLEENLTPLNAKCTFASATGLMTVTVAAGETAIISKRAADSAILQNGEACTVTGTGSATSTTVKKITVTATGNADTVVLDFTNGLYATGTSSTATTGIAVDMGAGTGGLFGIRGQAAADNMVFGASGITLNPDTYKDVTVQGAESYTVYLGDSADTFSAAGSATAGAVFGAAIKVYGGPGDDTFLQGSAATISESIYGGAGKDTVSYASRSAALTVTVGAGSNDGDGSATENDNITDDVEVVTGGSAIDTFTSLDGLSLTFNGGAGNDILTGANGNDVINGDDGDDTIVGKLGDDTLNGGAGDDTFDEEAADTGSDSFEGGSGTDVVDYSGRGALVKVSMDGKVADDGEDGEEDNVKATVENLIGTDYADEITGNALNNTITGGLGNDILDGGAGDDVFYMDADGVDDDEIAGGAGIDTVDYGDRTDPVHAYLDGETDSGKWDGVSAMEEADHLGTDVENLIGGDGDDILTGNEFANELVGGAGNDALNGDDGSDILDGGGGTEDNDLDCGAGQGDIAYNVGSAGSKTNCEF